MCVHLCCQLVHQEEPITPMLPNKALTSSSQGRLKDKLLTETIHYGLSWVLVDSHWLCLALPIPGLCARRPQRSAKPHCLSQSALVPDWWFEVLFISSPIVELKTVGGLRDAEACSQMILSTVLLLVQHELHASQKRGLCCSWPMEGKEIWHGRNKEVVLGRGLEYDCGGWMRMALIDSYIWTLW